MPPRRKHRKSSSSTTSNKPTSEVPIFNFESKWGKDKDLYFADGDSGTESDEEHLVEEAMEEEKKKFSRLNADDFKAFQAPTLEDIGKEIEAPTEDISALEEKLDEEEKSELREQIEFVMRTLKETSDMLQDEDIEEYQRPLLYSILTNGAFFVHIVAGGYMSPHHPCLDHIKAARELLFGSEEEEEEEKEEEISQIVAEMPEPEKPQKHIPDHLKKVGEGEFRPITRAIQKNQVVVPGFDKWKKQKQNSTSRTNRRKKYAHADHIHRLKHKRKNVAGDGIYKGERSGFNKNAVRSTSLKAAH